MSLSLAGNGTLTGVDADASGLLAEAGGIGTNVVLGTTTSTLSTTSATYVDTSLSASITPTSNTSKVLILVQVSRVEPPTGSETGYLTVFRGNAATGTELNVEARHYSADGVQFPSSLLMLDSPATTSATTYTLAAKVSGNTFQVQSGRQNMVLIEVAA